MVSVFSKLLALEAGVALICVASSRNATVVLSLSLLLLCDIAGLDDSFCGMHCMEFREVSGG